MYTVLLYYKFVRLKDPAHEVEIHREVCRALGLKGRILINRFGLNGTVAGTKEEIDKYVNYMNQHPKFKNTDFKYSQCEYNPFPKLKVRNRVEIITTDILDEIDIDQRAKHVDRDTFHQWLKNGEDIVLLDLRNDYEWEVGRFKGAEKPPLKYFRDLKDNQVYYQNFKDKKVVTYCTGGVRCEPGTAYLFKLGLDPKNVYQLDGGIVKYAEKYGDEGLFEGKCFVFDERMAVDIDTKNPKVVGKCHLCDSSSDIHRNCANKYCNKLFIGCPDCVERLSNTCSEECHQVIKDPEAMRVAHANDWRPTHRNK